MHGRSPSERLRLHILMSETKSKFTKDSATNFLPQTLQGVKFSTTPVNTSRVMRQSQISAFIPL